MSTDAAALLETIPMPVILIAADQTVCAMNKFAEQLLGPHVYGRHYITALRQPTLLEKVEKVLQGGDARVGRYLGSEAGLDTIYQVHIAASPFGVALSFQDQTADQEIGQLRTDFVANVSHELRTPLTALMGFIETLRGAAKSDPMAQNRFLEIMEREAGRMAQLIDDLLSLSRVEADQRVQPSEHVDLSVLVAATLANLEPVFDQVGARLNIDDQSAGAMIIADQGQIRQVASNLLENATKYGGEGVAIDISLTAARYEPSIGADGVRLIIRDNGPGIAEHHLARLTERFYRVDSHRSREVGGTGLGLAIVKHIINRHRGRFQIDSVEGEGAIFTVILPSVETNS